MNSSRRRPAPRNQPPQRLNIVERGARTGLVAAPVDGLTVRQSPTEPAALLAQRVLREIADSERVQRRIHHATLRTGQQDDTTTAAARRLILLGLASYAASGERSLEITVVAPPHASDPVRFQLLNLVDELLLASQGNVAVCLRFGEDELPSVSADRAAAPGKQRLVERAQTASVALRQAPAGVRAGEPTELAGYTRD